MSCASSQSSGSEQHGPTGRTSKRVSSNSSFWNRISMSWSSNNNNNHDSSNNSNLNNPSSRIKTGLLGQDADQQRTPLHIILSSRKSPADLVLQILQAEPKAASLPNHRGRLPLHFAVVHRHDFCVIAALIDAFPSAISFPDSKGQSPLQYAVDIAKRESTRKGAPPRTFWMPLPRDCDEAIWQEDQTDRWAVVHWLLLSSATHAQTSLSVGGRKPMLVEALLCAASPAVISLLVGASVTLLTYENKASAFAGSTLYTCITRHYPLSILMSLTSQCPPDVYKVRDETGMGLVSAQFIAGCFEQVSATQDWSVSEDFYACLMECLEEGEIGDDPSMSDWWRKIEFLIAFCSCSKMNRQLQQNGSKRRFDANSFPKKYLLHAALLNVDTPPSVIRMLLAMYPNSIKISDPSSGALPLHLAAMNGDYIPRNYEVHTIGSESTLEIIIEADRSAIYKRHEGRLPLHYAVDAGRMIDTLKPLLSCDETTGKSASNNAVYTYPQLIQRDPQTDLFVFLLAAMYPNMSATDSFRWTCLARNKYSSVVWQGLSDRQKASAVLKVAEAEELARLDTIFELLRRRPGVIRERTGQSYDRQEVSNGVSKEAKNISNDYDNTAKGLVSAHYISWCFQKKTDSNLGVYWEPNVPNQEMLRQAVRIVSESDSLLRLPSDFNSWWSKLIRYIRQYCRQQVGNFEILAVPPEHDEYLLHAALSNPDTPPEIVEIIIARDSNAASRFVPGTSVLPLHIAARTQSYTPRYFENQLQQSPLYFTLKAFPGAIRVMTGGRLPLHIAISSNKSFSDIKSLVNEEPRALRVKDPITGLYPALLLASRKAYTAEQRSRFQFIARNRCFDREWTDQTPQARTKQVQHVQKEHSLDNLSSIYFSIRQNTLQIQQTTALIDDFSESQSYNYLKKPLALVSPGLVTGPSDASTVISEDSFVAQSKVAMSPAARTHNPISLLLLLSQHRSRHSTKSTDIFENDASILSNVDVMSTISSTLHTNKPSTTIAPNIAGVEEESINLYSSSECSEDQSSYDGFAEDSEAPSSTTQITNGYEQDYSCSSVVADEAEQPDVLQNLIERDDDLLILFEIPRVPRYSSGKLRDDDAAPAFVKLIKRPPKALLAEIKAHSHSTRGTSSGSKSSNTVDHNLLERNSVKSKFSYKSLRSDEKALLGKRTEMLWMSPDLLHTEINGYDGGSNADMEHSSVSLSLPSTHRTFESFSGPSISGVQNVIKKRFNIVSSSAGIAARVSPLNSPSSTSRKSRARSDYRDAVTTNRPQQQAPILTNSPEMPRGKHQLSLLGSYGDHDDGEDDPLFGICNELPRTRSFQSVSAHDVEPFGKRSNDPITNEAALKRSSLDHVSQRALSDDIQRLDKSTIRSGDFLSTLETNMPPTFQVASHTDVEKHHVRDTLSRNGSSTMNDNSILSLKGEVPVEMSGCAQVRIRTSSHTTTSSHGNNGFRNAKVFNKMTMTWEDRPKIHKSNQVHEQSPSMGSRGNKVTMSFDKILMRWIPKDEASTTKAGLEEEESIPKPTPFDDLLSSQAAHRSKSKHHETFANQGRTQFRGGLTVKTMGARKKNEQFTSNNSNILTCLICGKNAREVLVVPCGHLCICRICSTQQTRINQCPLCSYGATGHMLLF